MLFQLNPPSDPRPLNLRRMAVIALADLAVLAELAAAAYLAHQQPEQYTFIFLKIFGLTVLPTLCATLLALRYATPSQAE